MPQDPSLVPRPSQQHAAWEKALHGRDAALLEHLASSDEPAAALLELETYINGIYRSSQHPLFSKPMSDVRFEVSRVLPYVDEIRTRVGWHIRDFDLGLLRLIRRSSALSPVLGAGVSMGAGAPSCRPAAFHPRVGDTAGLGWTAIFATWIFDNNSTQRI